MLTPRRIPTKRRFRNFVVAATQHAAAGFPQASDADVAARFAICKTCEKYRPKTGDAGECVACGCNVKAVGLSGLNKLRWADQACPIGKWLQASPPSADA